MRKFFLLLAFTFAAPIVLVISIMEFAYVSSLKIGGVPLLNVQKPGIAYAALPSTTNQLDGAVGTVDARVAKVTSFFHSYGSVLEQYSQQIVDAADQYNIDYRLLPALAMQESIGCKREIADTHNCWGWGIYGKKKTYFASYDEAIDTISKLLARDYIHQGHDTIEEIQKIYNPQNKNEWSDKVTYFMNQL